MPYVWLVVTLYLGLADDVISVVLFQGLCISLFIIFRFVDMVFTKIDAYTKELQYMLEVQSLNYSIYR